MRSGASPWALLDDGVQKPAGKVTIPLNQGIPVEGEVVEVRYLYAFRESGCIYQPVYLRKREDLKPADCKVAQLKFKEEMKAACLPKSASRDEDGLADFFYGTSIGQSQRGS